MSDVILKSNAPVTPYFERKIQCPAHYLVDPREDIFLREVVPLLAGVSKSACITYGVKKTRIKRDRWGNKMIDWKKMYELKKRGKILQPFITSSFAIEHVWDPKNPICMIQCKQRCKRGKGQVRERSIARLSR